MFSSTTREERRRIHACFWSWRFGHVWQPGLGNDGHPAYVCRDCPKALSHFGMETLDVSPKLPGVADASLYPAFKRAGWFDSDAVTTGGSAATKSVRRPNR